MAHEDCVILGSFPQKVREPLYVIDLAAEEEREASLLARNRWVNSRVERLRRNHLQNSVPAAPTAGFTIVAGIDEFQSVLAATHTHHTVIGLNSLWASRFNQIFYVKPIKFQLIGQEISQWVEVDKIPTRIVPSSLYDPENVWLKSIVDYKSFNEVKMAISHMPTDERILHLQHCLENAQLPPYEPDPYAIIELLREEKAINVQEAMYTAKIPFQNTNTFVYEFEAYGVKGVCAAGTKKHAKYGSALDFLTKLKKTFTQISLPVLNCNDVYLIEATVASFSAKFLIKYGKQVSCVLRNFKFTELSGVPLYICLLTVDGARQYAGWNYYSVKLASSQALKMAYEVELKEDCPVDAIRTGERNVHCYPNANIYHKCAL